MAQGNQAADLAAKRAAVQNNDLKGVASLVPQSNVPKILSYTEGKGLQAKSEGFQEKYAMIPKLKNPFSSWKTPVEFD